MTIAATLAAAAATGSTARGADAMAREWNFAVLLDGKPIGTHRFVLAQAGQLRQLSSDARMDVKILGLSLRHLSYRLP